MDRIKELIIGKGSCGGKLGTLALGEAVEIVWQQVSCTPTGVVIRVFFIKLD